MSTKQAKEKVLADIERIRSQRLVLEKRLKELQAAMREKPEPVRGFNLEDIERVSAAPVEMLSRINGIKDALKKNFFDDPEFCRDALTYLQEVEPEVKRLDRKRDDVNERIEKLKRELAAAEEAAESERIELCDQIDALFEPLGETIFNTYACAYTGTYVLNKLRKLAESGI